MRLVWHLLDWGWGRGRVRVGERRRWWTIGPVTVYGSPETGKETPS